MQRLLTSSGAAFWVIDAAGQIAYLSPALRAWLGVEDALPEQVAAALIPDIVAWDHGDTRRGQITVRLHLPPPVAEEVTAHYLRLDSWPNDQPTQLRQGEPPVVLGCLGHFVADRDVSWETWFGPQGVRDSARLDEQVAKFRAQQHHLASMLLAGNSSASRRLRMRVQLATRVRCHLALTGEPGSGANELAAMIHHASAPHEAFVCLDGSLMDAELLAVYASPVVAELREHTERRGTLCFERIDEMPADAQSQVIEWVQTWPQRLRLIGIRSAASPSSEEQGGDDLGARHFSLDEKLSDMLAVFTIAIPKLSLRSDDLELMTAGLLRSVRLSREALELFQSYPWPGEWEELKSAIQFASEMATADRIGREHLPLAIRSYRTSHADIQTSRHENELTIGPPAPSARDFKLRSLDETLRQYEASLITQAMAAAQGNKAEAARRLGISRSRLLRKLADMETAGRIGGEPPS